VAIVPSYIASCQINVIKPLSSLARDGKIQFKHSHEQQASPALIKWADVVVFCRNTEPGFRHLLNEALGRRRPVIYDFDDSFWDIPKETDPDLARYHLQPSRLRQLEVYLQYAALVRVYSPLLRSKVARFNSNARIYNSSFDFSQLPAPQSSPNSSDKIGIVYATSRIIDDQYKVFLPALAEFMSRHHDKVNMTVWGCTPPELLTLPGVSSRKLVSNYDDFLKEFARSGFQIGLAPLLQNEFNRSKNNTKFRDYGACGIAGIYSDVDAYSTSVENERNGLLVPNSTEAWHDAINRLVFDNSLRETVRTNAREKVYQNYRQELIEDQWLQDIQALLQDVPSYWLSNAKQSSMVAVRITAEHDRLCGVELRNILPHPARTNEKIYLEVQSLEGYTLRGIASSSANYDPDRNSITFNFEPLRHSESRSFDLRITGVDKRTVQSKNISPIYN